MWLFGHFALSHSFMPVVDEDKHTTWVRFAMEHSVDISTGNRVVDWVMVSNVAYTVTSHQPLASKRCSEIDNNYSRCHCHACNIKFVDFSCLGHTHALCDQQCFCCCHDTVSGLPQLPSHSPLVPQHASVQWKHRQPGATHQSKAVGHQVHNGEHACTWRHLWGGQVAGCAS